MVEMENVVRESTEKVVIDESAIGNIAVVRALRQMDKHQLETVEKIDSLGKDINKKLDIISSAFPSSDFEGHRRYHETVIELLAERRRLRIAIQEKTISGLIWVGIVGMGTAVWHGVVSYIKYGAK